MSQQSIITGALLEALFVVFRGDFQKALAETPTDWEKIATVVPSNTKSNTYGWLGQFPKMREWIGDRALKQMKAQGYSIENKDWESSVSVRKPDIEDDQVGIYRPLFQEMGRAAKAQPDELVFAALRAGITMECYDGQNFFDTEHPVYPEVDGSGNPALVSNVDSSGNGEYWYLLDTSRAIKPIIFQDRKKPVLTAMTKLDDEAVFTSNEFRFGADSRNNVGFGFWQMAYASNQPLTPENYAKARAALQGYKGDGGRPLNIKPTTLLVGPANESPGRKLLKKDENGGNEWAGTAELVVSSWLTK